jgi:Tol biopolymer transport system component
MILRRLLAVAMAVAAAACGGAGQAAPKPTPGAAPSDGIAAYDLVYAKVVDGNQDLYLHPVGGLERRLTTDPASDGLPRFTPDGSQILFSSDRSGTFQLWEIPTTGGEARRVRSNGAREFQADVSPDGTKIALLSNLDGPESLWIMERGSGASRVLVRHGRDSILGNPHWSPDGRKIVFSSNWRIGHQIYVVDVASGAQDRISPLTSGGCEPRFSPDGRKVVYVSRGHRRPKSTLNEHDLATGEERVLVDWPALNYGPVYSPDGTELAFASNITGSFQVYRQRLSDGRAWRVSQDPGTARDLDYRPRAPKTPNG